MLQVAGPMQLCAGQPSRCEAAVYAVFDSHDTEAVLQIDATNAFNCFNGQVALRKISTIFPSFA